jgi:hypothetical protein
MLAIGYGAVGYWLVEGKSMLDAFYATVLALSTLGVEAGPPPDTGGKVFTVSVILFGVVALFTAIGMGTQIVASGELGRWLRMNQATRTIGRLSGHYVICGYGRVGRAVLEELRRRRYQSAATAPADDRDRLDRSSVVLTADTYLSVVVELGLKDAAAAARLVLKAGKSPPPAGGSAGRCSASLSRSPPDQGTPLTGCASGSADRAREPHADHGASAGLVARRGPPAVGGADRLDDGEAEAGPAVVPAPAAVRPAEPLEGVRQERVREAGPVVADLDAQVGAVFPGRDHDDRPGGREASRVREQVVDGLADAVGVHVNPDLCRDVDAAGDSGRIEARCGQGCAAAEQVPQVRLGEPQIEPVGVASRQCQEVVGDAGEPVGFLGGGVHGGGKFGGAASRPGGKL